jgi:hypothetical protein
MPDYDNPNINNVTNDLLLKYDEKFNKTYNKRLFINSTIMNKEEILSKINDEILNKDVTIIILQYSTLLAFLIGALFIAYGFGKIDLKNFIIISVVIFIIYLLIIKFKVYYIVTPKNIEKNIGNLGVQMASYIDTTIEKNNPYTCPVDCSKNSSGAISPTILGYAQPTLNIDPQLDVWQYGDIPTDLYTTTKLPASKFYSNYQNIPNYNATDKDIEKNMPKPFFGTTYPSSTYYKCQWLGGDNSQGLPNKEDSTKPYSSIPCTYRQNYSEIGRYICSENPNNLSETERNNKCNDVSIINT